MLTKPEPPPRTAAPVDTAASFDALLRHGPGAYAAAAAAALPSAAVGASAAATRPPRIRPRHLDLEEALLRDTNALWRMQAPQREVAARRPSRLHMSGRPKERDSPPGGGGGGGGGAGKGHKRAAHRRMPVPAAIQRKMAKHEAQHSRRPVGPVPPAESQSVQAWAVARLKVLEQQQRLEATTKTGGRTDYVN